MKRGSIGNEKVFVVALYDCIRIRTGEKKELVIG